MIYFLFNMNFTSFSCWFHAIKFHPFPVFFACWILTNWNQNDIFLDYFSHSFTVSIKCLVTEPHFIWSVTRSVFIRSCFLYLIIWSLLIHRAMEWFNTFYVRPHRFRRISHLKSIFLSKFVRFFFSFPRLKHRSD